MEWGAQVAAQVQELSTVLLYSPPCWNWEPGVQAYSILVRYLVDPSPWVRKEARPPLGGSGDAGQKTVKRHRIHSSEPTYVPSFLQVMLNSSLASSLVAVASKR